jgi:AraC family transcriptional regulator
MQHRVENGRPLALVGMQGLYTDENRHTIPELWQRFAPRMESLPGRKGWTSYGLCRMQKASKDGKDALLYAAALETDPDSPVPEGMLRFEVPPARYAVFTHEGHISTISATWNRVFDEGLPQAKLQPLEQGYSFERYDERWNPETGEGPVEIWIPVA